MARGEGRSRAVIQRMQIAIQGAVQGVGFRPFIYRLASGMGLAGWVRNSSRGVFIEVEGEPPQLDAFLLRIDREKPPLSFIQSLEFSLLDPAHFEGFAIRPSLAAGEKDALILPDIATCDACVREILDPANRRYRYPFTNCTHCGPRFTIIESLPYDRPHTSMKAFEMCPRCRAEYEDPADRRFHAQPNACPACGPRLELWDGAGRTVAEEGTALAAAAEAVLGGKIVAVKGMGGFHLIADASSARAVATLRQRKHREEKPFALMFPSLDAVRAECLVSPLEERVLTSPQSPIVLLWRRTGLRSPLCGNVAPGNPCLGVMLPYTPLHHLLMCEIGRPVIATSGNLADEPICIDGEEALGRLAGIADLFLVHDRPIVRHVDDSIVRIVLGRELVLRRARGYAPLPLRPHGAVSDILAVGAHLKNTVAVSVGGNVFLSQHIGDLETEQSTGAFRAAIEDFLRLYAPQPKWVAADMHPDYASSRYARASGIPLIEIQHHHAHVAACMAENELEGEVLGVCWDGTGYGEDGTVWGGEFLRTEGAGVTRAATFRRFRLPGSERAVREPRRAALGALYEIMGEAVFGETDLAPVRAFDAAEIPVFGRMLARGIRSPWTTSAGRLFDAAASLAGLRQKIRFEGQAAMELESAAGGGETGDAYPFELRDPERAQADPLIVDWEPLLWAIIADVRAAVPPATIAARFHNALADIIVAVARKMEVPRVVLTGGCFQNRILLEGAVGRLNAEGFRPYWHQRVPPNDGGIALGQIAAASLVVGAGGGNDFTMRGGGHVPGGSGKD
ncbi:MAG: carbamoyltransferase HypF [Acidobacteria bacterium]|nr:carbamoyltransferase HypF [Acidobacteriota bacterium]